MDDDAYQLIEQAFETIALHGREGLRLAQVWPLLPGTAGAGAAAASARAFVWRQLRSHPELRFVEDAAAQGGDGAAGAAGGRTLSASELAPLEHGAAAAVRALATERSQCWAIGADAEMLFELVGVGPGEPAVPTNANRRIQSLLRTVAKAGGAGVTQSDMPKAVGFAPNYLHYPLKLLQAGGLITGTPVLFERADPSKFGGTTVTTNYRLTRLLPPPPPPAPPDVSPTLASSLMALLHAAPQGVVRISELQAHFGLRARSQRNAWGRVRDHLLRQKLVPGRPSSAVHPPKE